MVVIFQLGGTCSPVLQNCYRRSECRELGFKCPIIDFAAFFKRELQCVFFPLHQLVVCTMDKNPVQTVGQVTSGKNKLNKRIEHHISWWSGSQVPFSLRSSLKPTIRRGGLISEISCCSVALGLETKKNNLCSLALPNLTWARTAVLEI